MGVGRKEAFFRWSSTRNLPKTQLGGVIFGATNITIKECLLKQLFGLPKEHLEYVERIDPGLPLFLLNYSDRKLHGVFEAASHGQKNIDLYAWTSDGTQCTPYPAQVQVHVQSPRQPLSENQFKPIIADNYFTPTRFYFELDHLQTNRLLSLFSSQPVSASLTTMKLEKELKEKDVCMSFNGKTVNSGTLDDCLGTIGKDAKELVYSKLKELAVNCRFVDLPTTCEDEAARKNVDPSSVDCDDDTNAVVKNDMTLEANASLSKDPIIAQLIEKVEDMMASKTEQHGKISCLEKKIICLERNLAEAQNEIRNFKDYCIRLESILGLSEESDTINGINEFQLENLPNRSDIRLDCDDLIVLVGGYDGRSWSSSLDCYSPSLNQIKQLQPMTSARNCASVSVLDGQLYVFGGGNSGMWHDTVESYDPVMNEWTTRPSLNVKKGSLAGATLNDKIYAVGGGIDNKFYTSVEMLDLDVGAWIPSRPMLEKRFSLAAAELNGALYAVGGYDGKNYLKSAERFDPREHSWTGIESMNTTRGCPCLVVLNEKLYVLGGFDGYQMVPSVEIYDPRRGSWMTGEPMNYPRGFSAAAVIKDSIYIFGGLKSGEEMNETVECYKEGQGWEVIDTAASGRRGFFSAVAL